jgi:sugar phosphate isomerase/epimerase
MKLGIGTYCYMWAIGFKFGDREAKPAHPMTALGLLQRAIDLDIHLVQYGPNLALGDLPERELEDLIALARQAHVEFEVGTRGLETDHLRRQVEVAKLTGSKLIRTIPEIGGRPLEARAVPHYLEKIVPLLEQAGVKLGLENGKIPAQELAWALDQVKSPHLGVVLDMANSLAISEGWRYVTEILAPYTICLHHKEFVVQRVWYMMGFTVEGRPAGGGQVDTPWLLATLDKAGAAYNVILEVWPPEQPTVEESIALEDKWVRASIPYLRQFIVE